MLRSGLVGQASLSSESVEGTSLTFKSVDNVHSSDGLSLGVLAVGDCVTDDVLEEDLEYATGLFVDQTADTFHTTSSCKTSNGGFGDSLDVITQDFAMALSTSLSQAFASFAASRHYQSVKVESTCSIVK
jgi:hypothetical protein